jgi:hypothetical protein
MPHALSTPIVVARSTAVSVANTNTRVIGATFSGGTIRVGTVIRAVVSGLLTNTTAASTSVWTFNITGTTLTTPTVASWSCALGTTARTDCPFRVQVELVCLSAGESGTAWGVIAVTCNTDTALALPTTQKTAATTIDTTVDREVEFAVISGAASTVWNCVVAYLEVVNQ